MKRSSISLRLTAWFTGVFLGGFVIFGLVMWAQLAYSLSAGRDRTLMRRAARAIETLDVEATSAEAGQLAARFDRFAESTPEGVLIQILDRAGRRIYPALSTARADFPWPPLTPLTSPRFTDINVHGREYRVLQRPAALDGRAVTVVVGGQLEDNRQMLARFSAGVFAAIPLLLAVSAVAGYFMSRRVLRPVGRLTAALRSITIGNLSERLPVRQTGDELERLAGTCNEMLARLEAAVTQIKRFTADASHELRSPLSYICTVSEYALRSPDLSPDTRETFEDVLAEARQATQLLEDMLALARADAGHVDMPFEAVDLAELVRDAAGKARKAAETKGQRFALGRAAEACEIRGDAASLRRLLWILLDNAIKYTPEGGRVEMTMERTAAEGTVIIRDTGIGIPAALLPRVFDRFFRADPARSQDGTGLGLAIAKWIAGVHHAELTAESAPGQGSVFTLRFPVAVGNPVAQAS